jgi:hypothetical protein
MPSQAESKGQVQNARHLAGMSRVSGGARDRTVGRDFAFRYLANGRDDRSFNGHASKPSKA